MGKGKKRRVLFVNILVANRIRRMELLFGIPETVCQKSSVRLFCFSKYSMKFRKRNEQNIGHDYVISLSVDRATRKGPSLTTPSNAKLAERAQ